MTATDEAMPGLPESYRLALDELSGTTTTTTTTAATTRHPHPRTLTDEDMLILGREMLSNFYDARIAWSTIGNWSAEESKLTKLGGRASEAQIAGAGYGMAGVAGPYLETFVGSLEYKLGGEGRKMPTILSRRRTFVAHHDDVGVASCEVYGPAPLGSIPGNTFEVWTSSAPPPVAAAAAATANDETEGAGGEDGDDGGEDAAAAGEENDGGDICVVLCAVNQNFL